MACLDPRFLPARAYREATEGTREGDPHAEWFVDCGRCDGCRLNYLWRKTSAIYWHVLHDPESWLLTLTLDPSREKRVRLEPGELNPARERALESLRALEEKASRRGVTEYERERIERLREHLSARVDALTLEKWRMVRWVKRSREWCTARGIPMPRMTWCTEYGAETERPHGHAVVHGCSEGLAEALLAQWGDGFTHLRVATESAVGGYVAKDAVKGSFAAMDFAAKGLEPPRLAWPRNPYMGNTQEAYVYRVLSKLQATLSPLEFELALLESPAGRQWRHRGKLYAIADTAFRRGSAKLKRDVGAKVDAFAIMQAKRARQLAAIDPARREYDADEHKAWDTQIRQRVARVAQTQRRHGQIQQRKRAEARARLAARKAGGCSGTDV